MKFKNLFVAAAMAGLLAGQLKADDWSGFHVGLSLGIAQGYAKVAEDVSAPSGDPSLTNQLEGKLQTQPSSSNMEGGIEAGYNFQFGSLVTGLTADFSYLGLQASSSDSTLHPYIPVTLNIRDTYAADWEATLRPHIGWSWGKSLISLSGGLAMSRIRYTTSIEDDFPESYSTSTDYWALGWVVGASAGYLLSQHWDLTAEYLYSGFGAKSPDSTTAVGGFSFGAFDMTNNGGSLKIQTLRLGVNYHF